MKKFLEIRSKVKFSNTLSRPEQYKVYNSVIKEYGKLDNETQKYIDMDMHIFSIRRNVKYTDACGNKKRFNFQKPYSEEALKLYKELVDCSKLAVVKFMYLDYLVEFGEKSKKFEYAIQLLKECKLIVISDCYRELDMINVFSRYLDVVLSFNMKKEVKNLADSILAKIDNLYKCKEYSWIIEYAGFIRVLYKKIPMEIRYIDIDKRVLQVINEVRKICIIDLEESLVKGYSREYINWLKLLKKDKKIIDNVMFDYAELFEKLADNEEQVEKSSNFIVAYFLEQAAKIYLDYGSSRKAKELQVKIKNAYALYEKEKSGISFKFGVENNKLEACYNRYSSEKIEDSFLKFSIDINLIPSIMQIEIEANDESKFKFHDDMSIKILLDNYRKIFQEETAEDKKVFDVHQNYYHLLVIEFSVFYDYIFNCFKNEGLSEECFLNRIINWKYFDKETKIIIKKGLHYYWKEDYIVALSILVPQFEETVRCFFHKGGVATTVIRKGITQEAKTFGEFLDLDVVKEEYGEDLVFMIKFFLVDELGINLRNKIAHGLAKLGEFRKDYAHIMVYLYFVITNIVWKEND